MQRIFSLFPVDKGGFFPRPISHWTQHAFVSLCASMDACVIAPSVKTTGVQRLALLNHGKSDPSCITQVPFNWKQIQ